ncbi:MAG: FMN-binding protein [Planctomycetes bacterium]|nr:FMN-binding protein [Planctomycetota bacterium]
MRATSRLGIVLWALMAGVAFGDVVELLNGQRVEGSVVQMGDSEIVIKVNTARGAVDMKFGAEKVHAVTVKGERKVLNEKPSAKAKTPPKEMKTQVEPGDKLSRAELVALVDKTGRTPPDWWDSVPLSFPQTLDMTWTPPPPKSPWNPQKNIDQYFWSVVNENERQWKGGAKFAHHLLELHKNNRELVRKAMRQLAHVYAALLQDYARGAFWHQQVIRLGEVYIEDFVKLANCYWKLGCKDLAKEVITKLGEDDTRHGELIKLWADMGHLDKALQLAEAKAKDMPDAAYLAAGEACRVNQKYQEALGYYQKVVAVPQAEASRDVDRNKKRAQASIEAIRLFETLDVGRVPDGAYTANSIGYEAPIHVEVTVAGGKIQKVLVTQHKEKQFYSSIADTTRQIIEKQGVKGVDATSGATITSEAILNATAKALAGGMK